MNNTQSTSPFVVRSTPSNSVQVAKERPEQTSELLNKIPEEILLLILSKIEPAKARLIRATCFTVNRLIGELLCSTVDKDFATIKAIAQRIENLKPQTGSLGGRTITVIRSATVNPETTQANLKEAKQLKTKLASFKLYVTYLKQHATARHQDLQEAFKQKEKLDASLDQIQQSVQATTTSLESQYQMMTSPTVQKTQDVATRIFNSGSFSPFGGSRGNGWGSGNYY